MALEFSTLDVAAIDPELLRHAQLVWSDRVRTEYQSIQFAVRFHGETLAAGERLEVQKMVMDMCEDELRHAEVCGQMCTALGTQPPEHSDIAAPLAGAKLAEVPTGERVLASAISMFLIAETFSVGYIRDLESRCQHPVTSSVIDVIIGDEEEHQAFGPAYVSELLARESLDRRAHWRAFTNNLVRKHLDKAEATLKASPPAPPWSEQQLADLGLHSESRLAEMCLRTHRDTLAPLLRELELG